MKDFTADQLSDGRVPHVVPNVLSPDEGGAAGWGRCRSNRTMDCLSELWAIQEFSRINMNQ